jgi:hypothetical protein
MNAIEALIAQGGNKTLCIGEAIVQARQQLLSEHPQENEQLISTAFAIT